METIEADHLFLSRYLFSCAMFTEDLLVAVPTILLEILQQLSYPTMKPW
jgi:hypothetical protein